MFLETNVKPANTPLAGFEIDNTAMHACFCHVFSLVQLWIMRSMSSTPDEAATMIFSHGTTAGYVNSVD